MSPKIRYLILMLAVVFTVTVNAQDWEDKTGEVEDAEVVIEKR